MMNDVNGFTPRKKNQYEEEDEENDTKKYAFKCD